MQKTIELEALELNRKHCRILKAELGEAIGDVASVCVAINGLYFVMQIIKITIHKSLGGQ